MSNIEMQHANAILAIDSLDRYITSEITTLSFISVTWLLAAPTTLTLQLAGTVSVGAFLTSSAVGFPIPPPAPPGTPKNRVRIVAVNGTQVTINYPVTANSAGIQILNQFTTVTSASQPASNSIFAQFEQETPSCNDFLISSPSALIYGYIDRIIVSQIQLQYNIPTICLGRNDKLVFLWNGGANFAEITIPYGFYSPDELAAAVQAIIVATPGLSALQITVVFNERDGFTFSSANASNFGFAGSDSLLTLNYSFSRIAIIYKTYKTFGLTINNGDVFSTSQTSFAYPNFLYTPYIDIYSDVLTNYQTVKDTNTSVAKPKGLVARILLSGVGNPQTTNGLAALGTAPFVMTADLNNPKVIRWSPDVAVPSIDFQLRDCYGELIPGVTEQYPTEFQMTLLCIEG